MKCIHAKLVHRRQDKAHICSQIINATSGGHTDFVGTSWSIQFPPGPGNVLRTATFTVADDGQPTPDRIYAVQLRVTSGEAVISQSKVALVTVVGSHNPFGVFSFVDVSSAARLSRM